MAFLPSDFRDCAQKNRENPEMMQSFWGEEERWSDTGVGIPDRSQ